MNFLKLTLSLSLIGIMTLLILANTLEPKLTSIDKITEKYINKKIKIQGEIIEIKNYQNNKTLEFFYVLTIYDETGRVDIIFNEKNLLNLKTNQDIIVIGKVNQYKNNLQIQAEKIIGL